MGLGGVDKDHAPHQITPPSLLSVGISLNLLPLVVLDSKLHVRKLVCSISVLLRWLPKEQQSAIL